MQRRVDANALIEHEEFAIKVRAAALFEVLENAALELPDVFEALALHVWRGLLASNTARTERNNRRVFHLGREIRHRLRKLAERTDARDLRAFERAEPDFVIVARVVENDRAPLVKPLLQDLRLESRRGVLRRLNALDTKGNDLLLDAHQHAPEGLLGTLAVLGPQSLEPRNRAQLRDQRVHMLAQAGDKHVDALSAEEDGSLEMRGFASQQELRAQRLQVAERGELIARDIRDRVLVGVRRHTGWQAYPPTSGAPHAGGRRRTRTRRSRRNETAGDDAMRRLIDRLVFDASLLPRCCNVPARQRFERHFFERSVTTGG